MTVTRLDVHHEGSGVPSSDLERFASGGYTLGIGGGRWEIFRPTVDNWATAHWNHVDLAVCFSGNRMVFPITDDDLRCLREALAQERQRGEIVDHPDVHPHGTLYHAPGGNLPGSSPTQCPGLKPLDRWPEIVAACQASGHAPPPQQGVPHMGMVVIQPGGHPAGRDKKYTLYPAERAVLCQNGAALEGDTGDTPIGRWWHFVSAAMPDALCLRVDGLGVTATAADGGCFHATFA